MSNDKQQRNAADRSSNKTSHGKGGNSTHRERNIGHTNAEEHNRSGQHNSQPRGPIKKP